MVNTSACGKSWAQAQNGSGGAFSSRSDCVRSKDVYLPTLTVTPTAVVAGQAFLVSGTGFHPSTSSTLSFAVMGQPPYFSTPGVTNADGSSIFLSLGFSGCGASPPYDLTLTVTDSFGVHASAALRLC